MPWDVFANQLSRYLRSTYVATFLSGLIIAAEVTVLILPGDASDKRRVTADAIRTFWGANPGTLQVLLLSALTLLAAYLIGLITQSLLFYIRYIYSRLRNQQLPPEGMATANAPSYGEEAVDVLVSRYGRERVQTLIAKHPINVSIGKPQDLYKASEYSSFWLQRNVPEFQQSSLTSLAFVFYAAVVPILLAPFAIDAMQEGDGIMPSTVALILIAILISGFILSRANRMIDRVPTLLVRLFVAYALLADHAPAQPPAKDQNEDQGSRRAGKSPRNPLTLYRTLKAALRRTRE